jgi:stalled ribosome alternative rescue factor ArfA
MSKKAGKRPNKAKSIVAQPLFRSRQERPQKGKGSYRRFLLYGLHHCAGRPESGPGMLR